MVLHIPGRDQKFDHCSGLETDKPSKPDSPKRKKKRGEEEGVVMGVSERSERSVTAQRRPSPRLRLPSATDPPGCRASASRLGFKNCYLKTCFSQKNQMPTPRVCSFDFTLPQSAMTAEDLCQILHENCKLWVFQLECGSNSHPEASNDDFVAVGEEKQNDDESARKPPYYHYQGRVRFEDRLLLRKLIDKDCFPPQIHWSITSAGVHTARSFNYVTKEETRVAGPWSSDNYTVPPPLTRQLRAFLQYEMRPWQQQLLDIIKMEDDRSITCIVDRQGNSGKSIFTEYLEYNRLAIEIPPSNKIADISAAVIENTQSPAFVIDMPRALSKEKLASFYAGIETIKNGYAFDHRYKFRKVRFNRPQVVVFTNQEPDYGLLSLDRWQVYGMDSDKLIPIKTGHTPLIYDPSAVGASVEDII